MTRTCFAIATALLAATMFFVSSAEACISCNYTPEVVNTPVGPPKAKKAAKPERSVRPAKKHIAKRPPAAKKDVGAGTPVETSKTVPGNTQPETEASAASTAALADPDATPAEQPKVDGAATCKKFSATAGTTVTVPCESR